MATVSEIMTANPQTVDDQATLTEVAKIMRDNNIGDVIITSSGSISGLVTDRDIVVRAIAEGLDPDSTTVSEISTTDLTTISPDEDLDIAVTLMRTQSIRRLPVVENNQAVGVISLGDLAIEKDRNSVLADMSAAQPNN